MQLAVLARSVSGGALALLLFLLQRPLGERIDPVDKGRVVRPGAVPAVRGVCSGPGASSSSGVGRHF